MTYEFDRDTAVDATDAGRYAIDLAAGWGIGAGRINGGYLLAVLGRAIGEELGSAHPDPLSVSAHYLSAALAGPAVVETTVMRSGRQLATAAATLNQEVDGVSTPRIAALATFGDLDRLATPADLPTSGLPRPLAPPPDLPPLGECVGADDIDVDVAAAAPIIGRFESRLDPASAGWFLGEPSRRGVIQGWFRLVDERPLDPLALLMVVDVQVPVTFDLGLPGWAPTVELTAHIRGRPEPGWVMFRNHTRTVAGGMFEEDCEVWDASGRLVAQSRQLALLPRR